jgi:hypothetical protein
MSYYIGKWLPTGFEESLEVEGEDGRPVRFVQLRRWRQGLAEEKEKKGVRKMEMLGCWILGSGFWVRWVCVRCGRFCFW